MAHAAWTLTDVFGDGLVYDPVASFDAPGWLPRDRAVLDALTGAQLVLAGDFPVVCHRAVSTPEILALLEEAGHLRPQRLLRYADADGYRRLLAELAGQPARIVLQHSHPPGDIPAERLWIDPDVLRFVNNKGNLLELVPPGHAPERRSVPGRRLAGVAGSELRPPIVLKAAEDVSSGGGCGVRVCRTVRELSAATRELGAAQAVVVEAFVAFEITWCVQLIVAPDGSIRPVCLAEQICDDAGTYLGSWLAVAPEAPPAVARLGAEVADRVARRGYRGFVGVDVGLCGDGRLLAFDVNGRLNGSTTALSVLPSLASAGVRFARSGSWAGRASFADLVRIVRSETRAGRFVPLSLYDPRAGDPSAPPRVNGMILGATREEVARAEKELAAAGVG